MCFFRSYKYHGLEGNRHACFEWQPGAGLAIIWHLWSFVHLSANAVTGILTCYKKATAFHVILYRRRDVTRAVTHTHLFDACVQRSQCDIKKFLGFRRDFSDAPGEGRDDARH